MSATNKLLDTYKGEISQLASSVAGMLEDFRRLKRPLEESHKKVPQASNQLDKISQQTEAAAQQILDMIEHITQREEEVIKGIDELKQAGLKGDKEAVVKIAVILTEKAETNLNETYVILDSLQFQDITSQQMDHAASLLEDVEAKLENILNDIGDRSDQNRKASGVVRKVRAYDPHADMVDSKTKQADIDSLFENK